MSMINTDTIEIIREFNANFAKMANASETIAAKVVNLSDKVDTIFDLIMKEKEKSDKRQAKYDAEEAARAERNKRRDELEKAEMEERAQHKAEREERERVAIMIEQSKDMLRHGKATKITFNTNASVDVDKTDTVLQFKRGDVVTINEYIVGSWKTLVKIGGANISETKIDLDVLIRLVDNDFVMVG